MKKIVVKLGGSLISPADKKIFDFDYLDRLRTVLEELYVKRYQFAMVVGGGYICRNHQEIARKKGVSDRNLDWIGIASINLNAEMLKGYWEDISKDDIVRYDDFQDRNEFIFDKPVLVCAADKPGHSSDLDAINVAKSMNSSEIYRLTDVDAIYTKDPDEYPDAKKIPQMTWQEYYDVLGITEFTPGGHFPIDPVAAREAQKSNLTMKLMDGRDIDNFRNALLGLEFEGTIVRS